MTFKERLDALREQVKAQIKPESSKEEIEKVNATSAELDELEKEHNAVVAENAKFKDTIVKMVLQEGDGNEPPDDANREAKPKSIEEIVAEELNKQGGK